MSALELLPLPPANSTDQDSVPTPPLRKSHIWNLYLSHALSTWNARTYEFATILFTASAFPDTLLASSLRGLLQTSATLLLSFSIGRWVDNAPSRLRTLLTTICVNRGAVIVACTIWIFVVESPSSKPSSQGPKVAPSGGEHTLSLRWRILLFGFAVVLGTFERLSGIANLISMERDWLVVVGKFSSTEQAGLPGYNLTRLNAVMRRLDLVCKLVGPVVISFVIAATSMRTGVFVIAGMSASTWSIEVWSAWRVWNDCHVLRQPKLAPIQEEPDDTVPAPQYRTPFARIRHILNEHSGQIRAYFNSSVWIPSLALSLLHISVLTYHATLITWLLASGFSLVLITVVRAISSVVEISSTYVAPYSITYLAKTAEEKKAGATMTEDGAEEALLEQSTSEAEMELDQRHMMMEMKHGIGLERCGLWGISLQALCLIVVVIAIFAIPTASNSAMRRNAMSNAILSLVAHRLSFLSPAVLYARSFISAHPFLPSFLLFTFLSLSRLGLWTFQLTTQELTQTRVNPQTRSAFAGTEQAFVSVFELTQWIVISIFSRLENFKWLALGSAMCVIVSWLGYAIWVRSRRGHLTHLNLEMRWIRQTRRS